MSEEPKEVGCEHAPQRARVDDGARREPTWLSLPCAAPGCPSSVPGEMLYVPRIAWPKEPIPFDSSLRSAIQRDQWPKVATRKYRRMLFGREWTWGHIAEELEP